jgi:hypothetical protein
MKDTKQHQKKKWNVDASGLAFERDKTEICDRTAAANSDLNLRNSSSCDRNKTERKDFKTITIKNIFLVAER